MFYRYLCLIAGLVTGLPCYTQSLETNPVRERNFAFEVKQIDEFIERFNGDKNTLLRQYLRQHYPEIKVNRASMVHSLFNRKQSWKNKPLNAFLDAISNSRDTLLLDFYHSQWYAEAFAEFRHNGKLISVKLILRIQADETKAAKWMIMGAVAPALETSPAIPPNPGPARGRRFINPMSHSTNFIALSKVFRDKKNISDFLDSSFLKSPLSASFLHFYLNNDPQYLYVRKIRYHFLQTDGWVFTVDRYLRPGINSGWLISDLIRADQDEKKLYLQKLMNGKL